jgi:hypothetical protein
VEKAIQLIRKATERDKAKFVDLDAEGTLNRPYASLGYQGSIQGQHCFAFHASGWDETVRAAGKPSWIAGQLAERGFLLTDNEPGRTTLQVRTSGSRRERLHVVPASRLGVDDET